MTELLTIAALFISQLILICFAFKICEWSAGRKLLTDTLIFWAAGIAAYITFMYVTVNVFNIHRKIPLYAAVAGMAYACYTAGAISLWAIRKVRSADFGAISPSLAALAATVGFVLPIAALLIYAQLIYVAPECCGCSHTNQP